MKKIKRIFIDMKARSDSPSLAKGWHLGGARRAETDDGVVDNKNNVCFITTTPATPWPPLRQRRGISTEPRIKIFAACCLLFSILVAAPAFAATDSSCADENNEYVNQRLALCSTAAYNVGLISNPDDANLKNTMNEVVALKTTIMTQQMKKQYDYLETTIKRFKIQLEKAILTAKMEAAGAAAEAASGGGAGGSSSNGLSGTQNCTGKGTPPEVISCLQNNLSITRAAFENKDYSNNIRRQIANDASNALTYGSNVCVSSKGNPAPEFCKGVENCKTQSYMTTGPNGTIKTCIENLTALLSNASYNYSQANRQTGYMIR
ncbi:MAG: hypothetical protein LBJ18_01850 [Rickettsiales bacterium]|jgi:hypothetical protein|nr:hypothetical protein [Rickettsiales bacterium]